MSSSFAMLIRPAVLTFLFLNFIELSYGTRRLNALYQPPPTLMSYHKGALLDGNLPISILWYGKFTAAQKSIVSDFFLSLGHAGAISSNPSVSLWWNTVETYTHLAKKEKTVIALSKQVSDESYSLGKTLKRSHITELAEKASQGASQSLALVLTDESVAVEGFCMNSCGFHGSDRGKRSAFIWVGNSATQCPGQCAWPFHQPMYGPQTPPLVAPNNDVGMDGMIVNIASLLAGAVTNPFGDGFFQGPAEGAVEAAEACRGVYGKGAYPGYAGELLVESGTGASYNAEGVNRRKFLVPAVFDPSKSSCTPLV